MTEWADRYGNGTRWEHDLAERLRGWGWIVSPFGQGQLDGAVTRVLTNYRDEYGQPSGIRWLPDLIAVRGDALCLIDAKTSRGDHDSYKVECTAVEVHTIITQRLATPVYYVWEDGGVLTPAMVHRHHWQRMASESTAGSGTPFFLVYKGIATPASLRFGPASLEPGPAADGGNA